MGEYTDKAGGRVKQAAGALTGDDETRREGERQENKGEVKEKLNDAVEKAKDVLNDVKDRASRA